ncbi:MAG: restriction endonuclease subunit S [Paracoccus sp. (in: a-proteobacteria)]
MSRLGELINELCPNGVEYTQLNTVLDYEQPTKYIVESTNYDDKFETPVLTAGQSFLLGYTSETKRIYSASEENATLIFDDFTTSFHWVNFNFKIKSSAMKMLRIKPEKREEVLLRYVYHCMRKIRYEPVDHSRQWIAKFSLFTIALPPLEIQLEIVRILDNFTELTADLTAELTVRKKQYEYYKENLYNLEYERHTPMGDESIGQFTRGSGLQKKDFTETGVGCIHYGQIYTHYGTYTNKTKTFVSEEFAKKARKAKYGNLVIATTSENDEDVCKAVAWLGDEEIAVSNDACFYAHNLNPKYVAYFFQTEQFQKQKRLYITGTKVRRVNVDNLAKIKIPVPALSEQKRIVEILDRFDTICNDITTGLPAEIEARQKQYEYYRDKLLTFKKNDNEV